MAWDVKYANFALTTGSDNGSSEANAWRTWGSLQTGLAGHSLPTKIYCKGPETDTTLVSLDLIGTQVNPFYFEGYTTTPGDKGLCGLQHAIQIGGQLIKFEGFSIVHNQAGGVAPMTIDPSGNGRCHIHRCYMKNTLAGGGNIGAFRCDVQTAKVVVSQSYMECPTGTNNWVASITGQSEFLGCYITSDDADGILINNGVAIIRNCILDSNGDTGINVAGTSDLVVIDRCTIYNSGESGIDIINDMAGGHWTISNCLLVENGSFGMRNSAGPNQAGIYRFGNAYASNATGLENGFGETEDPALVDLGSLTASDIFVDHASGDFRLRPGIAAVGGAFPPAFMDTDGTNGLTTNHADIGAAQVSRELYGPSAARILHGV